MKKTLILPALFFVLSVSAQSGWRQSLHYEFHVLFHPAEKSLDAIMKLEYTNHSPDTITFIWFHVWPNAYRNDRTVYTDQLLENGDTRFYFSSREQKGYINRLDFRVDGNLARTTDHPEYIDVIKLILPKPLLPGDSISISSSFHLRLPFNFNGNGWSAHHFELKNWYPEPAVYDAHGWHPMPFLTQGGAYHEAADYQVEIELPSNYQIAASAVADTVTRAKAADVYHFSLHYANAFAWVADSRFQVKKDSMTTSLGQRIAIRYFYTSANGPNANDVMTATKNEMSKLSDWLLPYPPEGITIVQASDMQDQDFSGLVSIGMSPLKNNWRPLLRKALVDQWFQTILMTDQRDKPWLSKGFADYYDRRLQKESPVPSPKHIAVPDDNLWLRVAEKEKTAQPVKTSSPDFTTQNDSLIAGYKTSLWIAILKDSMGSDHFDKTMRAYFATWKFGHPYPDDFRMLMSDNSGNNLYPVFKKLDSNQSLFQAPVSKTVKPAFIFSARNTEKNYYIGLSPVAGYNRYDAFMLGALIHNISLPENNFEFLFTPMYAFGSKTVEGLGRLSYFWHPQNRLDKITVGLNGGRFDTDKATDSTGKFIFESFSKLVPYIRVDFKPSDPRSSIRKWMDFKTYLIWEKNYENSSYAVSPVDSLNHPNALVSDFYYVNQLSFNLNDNRTLYPYNLRVELQQSELFYRVNVHANYFLNYSDGGGVQVRFFAAKFGVWNSNNENDVSRFEPKLLGVTGEEDYLYEDYFVGRSASYGVDNPSVPNSGLAAQQIMNRDGGLKLRLDEYPYLQGKSSNWVSSLNFNTSLPAHLFPFPLPIRIFFDFGTYAEAWQNNAPTSKFLYTGGIQLSLFKNVLNIYAPLVYSSDFNDALSSTSFGKKITFSIDIQNINYKKIIRKIADHE